MTRKYWLRSFVVFGLLGLIGVIVWYSTRLANPAQGRTLENVSLRFPIPIVESGQTTFYVSADEGFYEREGLRVTFEMGSRELNPVKTVATNTNTFGLLGGPDTLLVARSKGQPLKAIAIIHRNSNFPCLITLKKSGITKLEQLQGKKIGFYYGHISTDVLRNLLRKNNIKYTEVDVGFDYGQLINGAVDACWAFTVTAGLDLPNKGIEINVISPAHYGIITQGYTLFATDKTIREQPDMVFRFLKASLLGVKYTLEHPEQANEILLRRDKGLEREISLKRQLLYNSVTSNSAEYPPGYMDREMFASAYERLLEENVIEKPFDISEAYTVEFLQRIYKRSFEK